MQKRKNKSWFGSESNIKIVESFQIIIKNWECPYKSKDLYSIEEKPNYRGNWCNHPENNKIKGALQKYCNKNNCTIVNMFGKPSRI